MITRAHVEFDPTRFGVRIAVQRSWDETSSQLLAWEPGTVITVRRNETAPDHAWLPLKEEVARAIYEALADHFGHAGHDTRALRKDYDAERKRVDGLIAHLTRPSA